MLAAKPDETTTYRVERQRDTDGLTVDHLIVSKANTVAQIVLAGTVLADEGFGLGLETTRLVLVWITGALTFASLAAYLRSWLLHMSGYEPTGAQR